MHTVLCWLGCTAAPGAGTGAACLDEGLLLLAGEAAEAVEALARAIAVIETAVGALSELGEVAEVDVVVHLGDGVGSLGASEAARGGEGTPATLVDVNLEEVLHASLARLVGELDGEIELVAGNVGKGVGGLAEVGGHLGVLEVAVGGLGEAAEVLDAVVHAGAHLDGVGGTGLDGDAFEDVVGEGTESVLYAGSSDDVLEEGTSGTRTLVARAASNDLVGAPDAAIGVVVDHEEALSVAGISVEARSVGGLNLHNLLHHGGLDSGEGIVAMGGDAMSAVRAVVAEVALAALDLAGVPKLVEVAVADVGVGVAGSDGGGVETASFARAGVGEGGAGRLARHVLHPVAGAVAAVLVVAGELLDVLAGAVAGAGVGAGGTAAALALVAVEALALASLAVADAIAGAPVRAHGGGEAEDGEKDGGTHGR